jgi:hypothetical protein
MINVKGHCKHVAPIWENGKYINETLQGINSVCFVYVVLHHKKLGNVLLVKKFIPNTRLNFWSNGSFYKLGCGDLSC